MPEPLEVLRVRGTHREAGEQAGEYWGAHIRSAVEFDDALPAGVTRDALLDLASQYREATGAAAPWAIEEIDGMAAGAGVDPLALFAVTIEELWPESQPIVATQKGRCSDLVAMPPATADGHVLVAHNNDLSADDEDELLAVEWTIDDEPVIFTIGGPPWLSVGFNSEGLSFTGNELSPNDERIGIPRQLHFRTMLRERTLEDALAVALHPDRASSYNNVITDASRCVNVEGSATDAELTEPGPDGTLAHTNHYACERMLPFEGDPAYAVRSAVRLDRAQTLLATGAPGSITPETLRDMLSDHATAPDALCRHPEGIDTTKTVFWCIADVTDRRVTFGRGNPCDSTAQEFAFSA